MIRSIRWKLLTWYTLLVAIMASTFCVITYFNVFQSINREVDEQLTEQATQLAAALSIQFNGKFSLELTPDQTARFQQRDDRAPYYRIWDRQWTEVDSSDPRRDIPRLASSESRNRNGCREVTVTGPASSVILVGRSMAREHRQLTELALTVAVVGIALTGLMLAGGWFLTSEALTPIGRISSAAAAISESNLSERIDASSMETELAQLSFTINDAFDRLQNSFDRQSQFTADASHELRTPLSIVMAQTQFALKRPRSVDQYCESLQAIDRSAVRMKAVVDGLLTLARADAGAATARWETLDLNDVVEEACLEVGPLADQKAIVLLMDVSSAMVTGDRNLICQAIGNLLVNAIQYNREGGRVDVKLIVEDGIAKLSITDSGHGIPESDQPYLFDRFYRVDKSRTPAAGRGSGLGLAITKWAIESHGGTVAFTSEEGVGSRFVVTLKSES